MIRILHSQIPSRVPLAISLCAPVAQLDRAPGFEPVGRGFKSLRARHNFATVRRIVAMRP